MISQCCSTYSDIYLFADDAKLFRHILHPLDCELLQTEINELLHWSEKWLLSLNQNKCKVVSFGRNIDKSHVYSFMQKGCTIPIGRETVINDLGVLIDEKLTFENHIHSKINKAYSLIGLIKRHFKYLTLPTFISLYKSIVRSQFEYCHSVWLPYKKKISKQ